MSSSPLPPATSTTPPSPSKPSHFLKSEAPFKFKPPQEQEPFSSPRSLIDKLWLTSKLSPPPPPTLCPPSPSPPIEAKRDIGNEMEEDSGESQNSTNSPAATATQFWEPGKIFVGNMPRWFKKNEIAEFFWQFGPIMSVILIKGHNDTEKNTGFGFVIYGGKAKIAENSMMKAVEFDSVEFHGRVLTVKLDDGRRMKDKSRERARWLEGSHDKEDYRMEWHDDRDGSRKEFRKVQEIEPKN